MVTYKALQTDRRQFLALTGLALSEFQLLLAAFPRAYQRLYPANQTTEGQPRHRSAGGGCKGLLQRPEDKLLFILVYLKTYPLQAVMGELFDLRQPQVNYWIYRLLPALQQALDDLGVCPERDGSHFAQGYASSEADPHLIIDGTERRRQRPKNPEKQALHYSGKKKTHTDKNVVIVTLPRKRIDFLSHTCVGKTHDKKIADTEGIAYPPEAILYKDTGFQGYEPAVKETRQAKKKATPRRTHRCREANEPEVGTHPSQSGACTFRGETLPHCKRCITEHEIRSLRCGDGSGLWVAQPSSAESQAAAEKVANSLFPITSNDFAEFETHASFGKERGRKILDALRQNLDPLELEVLPIDDRIIIELNVSTSENTNFKDASELSRGQKCTALLPILLARRYTPLVIDQPEDNLDNHFIYETVVDSIRRLKPRRQMIFITHNANIPVLGEAELVVVMNSDGQRGFIEKAGTVDECRNEIIDLLEGGEEAFELRRKRYGS